MPRSRIASPWTASNEPVAAPGQRQHLPHQPYPWLLSGFCEKGTTVMITESARGSIERRDDVKARRLRLVPAADDGAEPLDSPSGEMEPATIGAIGLPDDATDDEQPAPVETTVAVADTTDDR